MHVAKHRRWIPFQTSKPAPSLSRSSGVIIIVLVGLTAWSGYQARADQRKAAEREREREHEERALSMWAARRARRGGECVGRS